MKIFIFRILALAVLVIVFVVWGLGGIIPPDDWNEP